jgi:Tol biopolymer transport system component
MRIPLVAPGFRPAEQFTQVPVPSPEGSRILFRVFDPSGRRQLAVLSLATGAATALSGTDDAGAAFWSADGQTIGFYSAGRIRRIPASGGTPETIRNVPGMIQAAWNAAGDIIYSPSNRSPLFLLPASGGPAVAITDLDTSRAENSHRGPAFLPDGRHFIFTARSARSDLNCAYFGAIGSNDFRRLDDVTSTAAFAAVDGSEGWLVYGREQSLFARWFDGDAGVFRGPEQRLLDHIAYGPAGATSAFSLSANGRILVYSDTSRAVALFQTVDRTGNVIRRYSYQAESIQPRISPDERTLLFSRPDDKTGNRDLWALDLHSDAVSRLTTSPANDWWGVWGSDSRTILFASDRSSSPRFRLFAKHVPEPGAGEEQFHPDEPFLPLDASRDGLWLLGFQNEEDMQAGITILDLRARSGAQTLLDTEFSELVPRFSPHGDWLAYMSDENGRYEVYVRRVAAGRLAPSPRVPISRNGGLYPAWDPAGQELFYVGLDRTLYAVRFGPDGPVGVSEPLFRLCGPAGYPGEGLSTSWHMPYDVFSGGRRFLVQCRPETEAAQPFYMFRDWQATLKQ